MKVKLFYALIVLSIVSTVMMVMFGLETHRVKELNQTLVNKINEAEKDAQNIALFRAKIKAQKSRYGQKRDVLNTATIESSSKNTQGVKLNSIVPASPIVRDKYIEKGYSVKLEVQEKVHLARFMSDLEESIPGSKIKTFRSRSLSRPKTGWDITFIIVKSFPKVEEELAAN